jgi:tRNA(Ile)-lysidine synthase
MVAGDRVAVAISGGSDSVALFWLLHALAPDLGLELAGLVHVNHQLRGAESDGDEAFCRRLADRMGLPIAVAAIDVAADARARRVSIEVAARDARYAFFERAAADLGATVIVTGHTLDDQAENRDAAVAARRRHRAGSPAFARGVDAWRGRCCTCGGRRRATT